MAAFSHVYIIYNPNSTGNAEKNAKAFRHALQKNAAFSVPVKLVETEHAGHAEELSAGFASSYDNCLIISSGGDGSYHEVINGVLHAGNSRRTVVGLLPSGNANDNYRAVHQPGVIDRIITHSVTPNDVIKVTMSHDSRTQVRYAHSYAGIGLTPHVGKELNKQQLNRFNELLLVLRGIWRHRSVTITVSDRRRRYESLIFSNIAEMSKVLTLSKSSSIHDGLFEINGVRRSRLPTLMSYLIRATTIGLDEEKQARSFSFTCTQKLDLQIDGEIYHCSQGMKVTIEGMKNILPTII